MSEMVEIDAVAPDFELPDVSGRRVRLASFRDRFEVVLVFNRGFA